LRIYIFYKLLQYWVNFLTKRLCFFYRGTQRLSTPRNVPIKLFIAQHAINVNLMCSGSHKNFAFLDKMFKVELVVAGYNVLPPSIWYVVCFSKSVISKFNFLRISFENRKKSEIRNTNLTQHKPFLRLRN
jgi:hypothetical protein